ncbi:MAG TPA: agmatinase family protein [Vicinamibacteria bacterium]|jgi:agmatinase
MTERDPLAGFDPSSAAVGGGIYGLPFRPEDARVVLVPVPWEATVSYGAGTADGPAAILRASRQVDLLDRETGRPYEAGIAMLPIPADVRAWSDEARALAAPVIASGGPGDDPALREAARAVDALGERMNSWVHDQARHWLGQGKLVGVVGGDHSVPLGAIRAAAERHPGLGVLHFDAHADLREAYEGFRYSHASIMYNVLQLGGVGRLVQVGVRDFGLDEDALIRAEPERVRTFFDPDLRRRLFDGESWNALAARMVAELPHDVFVSFDIDGLDPALCPHTGTPVLGGLSFAEACAVLRTVAESGRRIVGFDLNEVAPDPGGSEWDGNVGARVLYKEIGFALLSQGN